MPTIHVVWAQYLCTVATRQWYTPCGHGVCILWPHGDRRHHVGTMLVYRVAMVSMPRQYVRSPCGHGTRTLWPHSMYNCRVDMVHAHPAITLCMVAVWPRYLYQVGMVSVYCGHMATVGMLLAWCQYTMTTRQPYMWCGHGICVP